MKRAGAFSLLLALVLITTAGVHAQRRDQSSRSDSHRSERNHNDRNDRRGHEADRKNRSEKTRYEYDHRHDSHVRHQAPRRETRRVVVHHAHPVYTHFHSSSCVHHRTVVRRVERPRYIYYDDYNTYYDLSRNVYVTWSGRGWTISSALPAHLHHVDLRRAVVHEVNYYDDDFVVYLENGRPVYGNVYVHR